LVNLVCGLIAYRHQPKKPSLQLKALPLPMNAKPELTLIKIKFATTDCQACSSCELCTRSTPPRRTIIIWPRAQHEALQEGRKREQTTELKDEYAKRGGVEGTISQSVRTCDVRRTRYIGQAKDHLQHLMTISNTS
jgi:transposase